MGFCARPHGRGCHGVRMCHLGAFSCRCLCVCAHHEPSGAFSVCARMLDSVCCSLLGSSCTVFGELPAFGVVLDLCGGRARPKSPLIALVHDRHFVAKGTGAASVASDFAPSCIARFGALDCSLLVLFLSRWQVFVEFVFAIGLGMSLSGVAHAFVAFACRRLGVACRVRVKPRVEPVCAFNCSRLSGCTWRRGRNAPRIRW